MAFIGFLFLGAGATTAAATTAGIAIATAGTMGALALSGALGGKGGSSSKMPGFAQAGTGQPARTAGPAKQLSEAEKLTKRMSASSLTRDWSAPKLAKTGLLGLGAVQV